jgi:hypothetical protein
MSLSVGCFFAVNPYYNFILVHGFHIMFISHTCRAPTISVLILAIFPLLLNLLLRSWRRSEILQRGVLGLWCPRSSACCVGTFHNFTYERVDLVFYKRQ